MIKHLKFYFLKVQPEATESFTNESFYDDQLLVIDKLKSLSPVGTKIYKRTSR